jgi:hypothetical protein
VTSGDGAQYAIRGAKTNTVSWPASDGAPFTQNHETLFVSSDVGESFDPCRNMSIPVQPQGAYRSQLENSFNGKIFKVFAAALTRAASTYPLVRGQAVATVMSDSA